jgi:hypothetical protein
MSLDQLAPEQISNEPIREAHERLAAARLEARERRQDAVQLEQERPNALVADAEAEDAARAAGKAIPKRVHTAKADKEIEDANHAKLVAEAAVRRLESELVETANEHGAAWQGEVSKLINSLRGKFDDAVLAADDLLMRLTEALKVANALDLDERQVPMYVHIRNGQRGGPDGYKIFGAPASMLEALAAVNVELTPEPAKPKPAPIESNSSDPRVHDPLELAPVRPMRLGNFAGNAAVEREVEERNAFLAARGGQPAAPTTSITAMSRDELDEVLREREAEKASS